MEQSAREKTPLDVRVCTGERIESRMKPEQIALESSSTGMGRGAPGQQRLSSWEMQHTSADGCSLVDRSSDLGETTSNTYLLGWNSITKLSLLPHHAKPFFCR